MTPERFEEIIRRCRNATKGPWYWDVNPAFKRVDLTSGKSAVMVFKRWGMNSAQPMFLRDHIYEPVTEFTRVVPGREHHAEWFQDLDHPDANFIAHARQDMEDLIEALYEAHEEIANLTGSKYGKIEENNT